MASEVIERAHKILAAEAAAIAAVDLGDTFVSSVEALLTCRGKVVATGMGKAGLVAKRFCGHALFDRNTHRLPSSGRSSAW